jgi:hypothetical protein
MELVKLSKANFQLEENILKGKQNIDTIIVE